MTITVTHTKTYNEIRFADPYKRCRQCGQWVDGYLKVDAGPDPVTPCEHLASYDDVCPSWGPVDGCTCPEYNARHPQNPIVHDMRPRPAGDDRRY